MSAQETLPRDSSDIVRVIGPMKIEVLSRLMIEYGNSLNKEITQWRQSTGKPFPGFKPPFEKTEAEMFRDIRYLRDQLLKLVNKASAYHEHITIDEGERFELELRLFDAEDILRVANAVLERHGIK